MFLPFLESVARLLDVILEKRHRPQEVAKAPQPQPEPQPEPKPNGYVYLLRGEGVYKIGRAKRVDKRVTQFSPKLPFDAKVIHTIPCYGSTYAMHQAETRLHTKFAGKRKRGEWFTLTDGDVEYIKTLVGFRGGKFVERGQTNEQN